MHSERASARVLGHRVCKEEAKHAREARREGRRVQGSHGLHAPAASHQPGRRAARGLAPSLALLQEVRTALLLL